MSCRKYALLRAFWQIYFTSPVSLNFYIQHIPHKFRKKYFDNCSYNNYVFKYYPKYHIYNWFPASVLSFLCLLNYTVLFNSDFIWCNISVYLMIEWLKLLTLCIVVSKFVQTVISESTKSLCLVNLRLISQLMSKN